MSAERGAPPKPDATEPSPPERLVSGVRAKVTPSDEDLDLTPQQQARIEAVFAKLNSASLYDLLGVAPTADKKAIKTAYYERTSEFHPDRFFRKRLGTFKAKMEAIFGRMTDAHELLCSPSLRSEYDAALRANRMGAIDALLEQAALEIADEQSGRDETHFDPTIRVESSVAPPIAPSVTPPPVAPSVTPPASAAEMQARRDALARRLLGGGPRRPTPPPSKLR